MADAVEPEVVPPASSIESSIELAAAPAQPAIVQTFVASSPSEVAAKPPAPVAVSRTVTPIVPTTRSTPVPAVPATAPAHQIGVRLATTVAPRVTAAVPPTVSPTVSPAVSPAVSRAAQPVEPTVVVTPQRILERRFVLQRAEEDFESPAEPTEPAEPVEPPSEPAAATPSAAPQSSQPPPPPPAGPQEPEELLKTLFDPLLRRLRTELRLDRERRGVVSDRW